MYVCMHACIYFQNPSVVSEEPMNMATTATTAICNMLVLVGRDREPPLGTPLALLFHLGKPLSMLKTQLGSL